MTGDNKESDTDSSQENAGCDNHLISKDNQTKEESEELNRKYMDLFKELEFVAKGGFGSCSKVIHLDSGLVLIRKTGHEDKSKTERHVMYMINEALALKECEHKYVVKYYNSFKLDEKFYLFMENADLGDLQKYIDRYVKKNVDERFHWKESKILKIFVQLLLALKKVHSLGYMHRDIKCKNTLLFKNKVAKICDFGICKRGDLAQTKIGDLKYIAPEIMSDDEYTKEVDTYSLGVLLHYLIYLDNYQVSNKDGELKRKNKRKLDSNSWVSDDLLKILKKMLRTEGTKRITLDEIIKEKVIQAAITKLQDKEKSIREKVKARGIQLSSVFSDYYLHNKVEFKKCLFCGFDSAGKHECPSLYLPSEMTAVSDHSGSESDSSSIKEKEANSD